VNHERRPGRVLRFFRPVWLGAAAATAWLALSAAAASADAGTDHDRLLGGLTSTISSVSAAAPEPAQPGVQLSASELSSTVGRTIDVLPVVTHVVPAQTPAALVSPVVALVDAAAGLVEPALLAAAEAAPVIAPILAPATAVLTGPAPLPGTGPVPEPALDPRPGLGNSAPPLHPVSGPQSDVVVQLAASSSAAFPAPVRGGTGVPEHLPGDRDMPPAMPRSGSGSHTQSGPSGPAALDTKLFQLSPLTGIVPIRGPLQHTPQPVSFDPGSSPD
jgi:hypothetical protein